MSLATYSKSNTSDKASVKSQAVSGRPTVISRLRKGLAAVGRALISFHEAIAEARVQRAMIEAELYRKRYLHSSKNDDDLPIVR